MTYTTDPTSTPDASQAISAQPPPLLYGFAEAARLLSISIPSLKRWYARGDVAAVKLGGRTLFTLDELQRISREGIALR